MESTHVSSAKLSNYVVHVGHKEKRIHLRVTGASELEEAERTVIADNPVEHVSNRREIAHTMPRTAS
jgi:hypothetical protein